MSTSDAATAGLALDRAGLTPLHQQLTAQLRDVILAGRIRPGAKLPASRILAEELGVSRITVTTSMDQLVAEGFAQGVHGRGLFVVPSLPDAALKIPMPDAGYEVKPLPAKTSRPVPFQPAAHDPKLFPHEEWARLLQKSWSSLQGRDAAISSAGFGPLREAIARHLHDWRGLKCQPAQVFVTAGAADSIQLIIRTLDLPGKSVVLEDPGYPLFGHELSGHGARAVPVPVDASGLNPANLPPAALVITTPSRHYPTGVTMPLSRRLDLLAWAEAHDAMIAEDDFDSEYRYRGTPLPTLMGQAASDRVLYLGSFSKVFSPLIRLGYMVTPSSLVERFEATLEERGAIASAVAQPALAQFMSSGRFATHIRRMRRIYASRQEALVGAVGRHLSAMLTVQREAGGMHLLAEIAPTLAARMNDEEISQLARTAGLSLPALSRYCAGPDHRQGLLMGYSGFDEVELDAACAKLASVLQA